ncbi:MAG: hypothetical protein AB8H79_21625 [Myxococcota bacterium]
MFARLSGVLVFCVACTGPMSPPTPEEPPPVTPAPPASPAAQTSAPAPESPSAATGTGHCAPDEKAYFDCPVAGGKHLSLCGGPDPQDAQYRYGRLGEPELVFPQTKTGGRGQFTVEGRSHVRTEGRVAMFENGGFTYEVSSYSGSGCCAPGEGEANNFKGVWVHKADETIANIDCTAAPTDQLDEWSGE